MLVPIIIGISVATVILLLLIKPAATTEQNPQENTGIELTSSNTEYQEEKIISDLQSLKISFQDLKTRYVSVQTRMDTIEAENEAYKLAVGTLRTSLEAVQTKSNQNQNYISTIYRQVLDLELKVGNIGGGYQNNVPRKPEERVVNPYIGNDQLP